MDSTLALLSEARCLSFRRLCASLDTDFEGLTIASRKAKTTKLISPALCRRLQQLDVAYAFARHITRPRVDRLIAAVDAELAALTPCRDTTTIEKSNEIFEIIDDCVNSPESPNSTSTESTRCSSSYTPSGVRDLCKDFEAAHFSIYDDDDDNNGETSDSLPAPGSAVKHLEVPASCASHFSIYDVDDDNNDETSDSFHAPGDAVRHLEVPASCDLGLPEFGVDAKHPEDSEPDGCYLGFLESGVDAKPLEDSEPASCDLGLPVSDVAAKHLEDSEPAICDIDCELIENVIIALYSLARAAANTDEVVACLPTMSATTMAVVYHNWKISDEVDDDPAVCTLLDNMKCIHWLA
mmetsp:Transcript_62162/g.157373  ORF Transcript_62162/g.157373 Transcript_62162/m.157373 type:complete len:352 (-) Transcript_62162:81-1136(-)|eukprot:CAMPEP_0115208612 /NCGR_PEP_ID=MMETSP0270-20121206/21314_1 /TAXON_ID=71861 /ORGANISM="Scrippsiella trochoidea, Strain CCMP3099" /LENGTH=351 /DNA_ID=CAMNT_0002622227 /DNA_START=129 /DNA_END=1184 /DNA_ORIENTATION=+